MVYVSELVEIKEDGTRVPVIMDTGPLESQADVDALTNKVFEAITSAS